LLGRLPLAGPPLADKPHYGTRAAITAAERGTCVHFAAPKRSPVCVRPVPRQSNIYPLLLFHVAFLKHRWAESIPDTGVLNGRRPGLKKPGLFLWRLCSVAQRPVYDTDN
jgi:hypothetical protein